MRVVRVAKGVGMARLAAMVAMAARLAAAQVPFQADARVVPYPCRFVSLKT